MHAGTLTIGATTGAATKRETAAVAVDVATAPGFFTTMRVTWWDRHRKNRGGERMQKVNRCDTPCTRRRELRFDKQDIDQARRMLCKAG